MLEIFNNSISLNRGENATIEVVIYDENNNVYEMQEGDILKFIVGKKPKRFENYPPLINKEFNNNIITLENIDTQYLSYGNYLWQCNLILKDGTINVIRSGDFTLLYNLGG